MKKWLLFIGCLALLMMLAACTSEVDGDEQVKTPDTQEETRDASEKEDLQKRIKAMHLYQLYDIAENVGFMNDGMEFYEGDYYQGLVYADVMDFNQDGFDELVTLVKGSAFEVEKEPYNSGDYIFEVRGLSGDGYAVLYSKNIPVDECLACDLSISLTELDGGKVGFVESIYKMSQGVSSYYQQFYVLKDDGEFEITEALGVYGEENEFTINDKVVTEEEYNELEHTYPVLVAILISEVGMKSLPQFELTPGQMVSSIYDRYEEVLGFNEMKATNEELDADEVQNYVNNTQFYNRVDILDRSLYSEMMKKVLFANIGTEPESDNGVVEFDGRNMFDIFWGTFGAPIEEENLDFLSFAEEDDLFYEDIVYDEGTFYVRVPDARELGSIRKVKRAVEIESHMYMEVEDIDYDWYQYYAYTGMTYEEQQEAFLEKPIAEWPAEARKFAKSGIPRYMLLTYSEGYVPKINYIGYRPLTENEIMNYIYSFE